MSNNIVIVTFDIGGKLFHVSKELLQKYPKTMLCNVVGDIDEDNDDHHHNEPIFIDGNSERFGYVIDYMRYQKVELPNHIGKDSFRRDLDYYGFDHVEWKHIETISQKTKREERMAVLASRYMYVDIERYEIPWYNDFRYPTLEAIELGLHILSDSRHEEHESYRSTLASILSRYGLNRGRKELWLRKQGYDKIVTICDGSAT